MSDRGADTLVTSGDAGAEIDAIFDRQRRFDALGHNIHTGFGVAACVLVAGPVTVSQGAMFPLLLCMLIRTPGIYCTLWRFFWSPFTAVLLAWSAWHFISMLWTRDRMQAWDEIADLRGMGMALGLWAVMDRRRYLVAGLVVGLGLGVVTQVVRAWHPEFLWGTPRWDPDRISGWWHPVVGGSILTAGLGLHLPAAMLGRGWVRIAGIAGAAVMAAAVLATGSRGAWIGSAALVVVTGAWVVWRRGVTWRGAGVAAVVVAVIVGGVWAGIGGALERRFVKGVTEVREALTRQEFNTDTGGRLLMAWWALEAIAENPAQGVGAGGYREWVRLHLIEQGIDPATRPSHGHAHCSGLHIGATLGLVGVGLATAIVGMAVRGELRRARCVVGAQGEGWGVYELGPGCALAGMVLASAFDTVHLNAQSAAVLSVLVALCVPMRPTSVAFCRRG